MVEDLSQRAADDHCKSLTAVCSRYSAILVVGMNVVQEKKPWSQGPNASTNMGESKRGR